MKWITFFSQTGSEIIDICERLNVKPSLIITNNFKDKINYNPKIRQLGVPIITAKHNYLMDYLRLQTMWQPEEIVCTLHGYLRIIPEDVCNKFTMYNGHPGLINTYPELKGKDPQIRAWKGKYHFVGSVVHKVTPGVDEGEILFAYSSPNTATTLDEMYGLLKSTSLESWLHVVKGIIK